MKVATKLELREALDNLWNVADAKIKNFLDAETLKIAEENHDTMIYDRDKLAREAARER